jgi:hypothetical protein
MVGGAFKSFEVPRFFEKEKSTSMLMEFFLNEGYNKSVALSIFHNEHLIINMNVP